MQAGPQVLEVVAVGPGRCQVGPLLTVRDSGTVAGIVMYLQVELLKRYLALPTGQVTELVSCLVVLTGQAVELVSSQLEQKHSELELQTILDVGFGTH